MALVIPTSFLKYRQACQVSFSPQNQPSCMKDVDVCKVSLGLFVRGAEDDDEIIDTKYSTMLSWHVDISSQRIEEKLALSSFFLQTMTFFLKSFFTFPNIPSHPRSKTVVTCDSCKCLFSWSAFDLPRAVIRMILYLSIYLPTNQKRHSPLNHINSDRSQPLCAMLLGPFF